MKYSVFSFLILFSCQAWASGFEIVVKGNFPGAEGREIRFLEYADQVTWLEKEIGSVKIDGEGYFQFNFLRFQERYLILKIEYAQMGFFVQPGKEYYLEFDSLDFSQLNDRINPYYDPWYFDFKIEGDTLNRMIDSLDITTSEFMTENFPVIRRGRNYHVFNDFIAKSDSIFLNYNNPFFQNYYRYSIGYYRAVAGFERFQNIVDEYILHDPVLYHNTQYMSLFNTLFDTYIFAQSRKIEPYDLLFTVNELAGYNALMDSLGKDTLLVNEVIRELVMIKGLQTMYNNPDFNREHVIEILTHVSANSKFPEHRLISANVLESLQYLKPGSAVPQIQIVANENDTVLFPQRYSGKYIYLVFYTTWCETCQVQFAALEEIKKLFEDDLEVIAISKDRNESDFVAFKRGNEFPSNNFHFGYNYRFLDEYQVGGIPLFVLIDREGRVVSFPAPVPSDELVTRIQFLLFKEKNQGR